MTQTELPEQAACWANSIAFENMKCGAGPVVAIAYRRPGYDMPLYTADQVRALMAREAVEVPPGLDVESERAK